MADLHADYTAKRLLQLHKEIICVSSGEQLPVIRLVACQFDNIACILRTMKDHGYISSGTRVLPSSCCYGDLVLVFTILMLRQRDRWAVLYLKDIVTQKASNAPARRQNSI